MNLISPSPLLGKNELAIKLLDYEPRAAEQVPALMRMECYEKALEKSILSGK